MAKKIVFRGSIAPTMASLKFGGDEGRVTFAVPKMEVPNAVGLIALQELPLIVTVEVDEGKSLTETDDGSTKINGRTTRSTSRMVGG